VTGEFVGIARPPDEHPATATAVVNTVTTPRASVRQSVA
jgi:hypothetical protein